MPPPCVPCSRQLPAGTWELVTHPGYNDADLARVRTRLRASRDIERLALAAIPEVPGIELISFADLAPNGVAGWPTINCNPCILRYTARVHNVVTENEFQEGIMRIGITCYPTYGGSGVVATELGIELAALGHEIHFISYSQPFRLSGRDDGIFYHEVPVSSYPLFEFPPYDLALASRMAEVAEYYALDLLHVHYAIPHSVSALLARQMLAARGRHLPFVTTLHGTDITLVGLDRSYLPDHALRHPGKRRRDQHLQLPARKDHRGLRHHAPH